METKPLISSSNGVKFYDDTYEKLIKKNPNPNPNPPTFDDLLHEINDFGRYQIRTVLLLLVPAAFLNVWQFYNLVFMLYNPDKECQKWNVPFKTILKSYGNVSDQCQYEGRSIDGVEIHCQKWTFTIQYYENTVATQWGPCQNQVLLANVLTIFSVVSTIGGVIMSIFQDIIGRKMGFVITLTLRLIGSGGSLLATSLEAWVAIRSIQILLGINISISLPYMWTLEFSGPQKRTVVNFSFCMAYSCAVISVGLVAWVCNNWTQLGLITFVPFLFCYISIFFVDESPRWLLSVGKVEKAMKVMEKIAKMNRKESNIDEIKHKMQVIAKEKVEEEAKRAKSHKWYHILDLIRYPNLRKKVLLMAFTWCSCNLLYVSQAFNSSNVANIFVAYIAQAAVALPASIFSLILPNRIGRIPPIILGLCWSALFSFLCIPAYLNGWNQWSVICFSAMVKFGATISWDILLQTSPELYPTSLRALAVGVNIFAGNVVTASMPHILATSASAKWIPMFIMGMISILAAACCCFLPEPMDQPMPLVVADAERFSKVGFGQIKTHWKNLFGRRGDYAALLEK